MRRAMSGIKKLFTYICLSGLILLFAAPERLSHAHAQTDPEETLQIVQQAIADGDAQRISKFMSTYTEVSILGATTMHSRAQTAYILKAFFKDHPPERFAFQHKLKVGRDWYVRGSYWNKGRQAPYRMELTMQWNGQRFLIKSIKIKRANER